MTSRPRIKDVGQAAQLALLPFLLVGVLTLGGCSTEGGHFALDLLPATTTNRIEAAVTLPRGARLHLEWAVPAGEPNAGDGVVSVWIHRPGHKGELVSSKQLGETGAPTTATVDLGSMAGKRVFLRATAGASQIDWVTAELLGRSASAEPRDWRIRAREGSPAVIVYLIDTLRPDVLAPYGGPDPTPTFARLAAEGTVFERAYSTSSWTRPAVASLFSGLATSAHEVKNEAFSLSEEVLTLAERFRLGGYQTMGVISNGHVSPAFGFDQGFELYTAPPEPVRPKDQWDPDAIIANNSAEQVHAMVLDHIANRRDPTRPLFLYVHTVDPHNPYDPPRWLLSEERPSIHANEYLLRKINEEGPGSPRLLRDLGLAYRGAVAYADEELGKFLSSLGRSIDPKNSVLVVTSDHGEAFYEHGLVGHRHWIHEELIRIPLIMRAQGLAPGTRNSDQVSIVDVLPTLLHLAGVEPGGAPLTEGRDLSGGGPGAGKRGRAVVAEHAFGLALVRDEWKLTHRAHYPANHRYQLFNLRLDPGERTNRVDRDREVVRELLRGLRKWRHETLELGVDPLLVREEDVPQAVIDNLRALGYLD